jgi:molybdopterin adenylyltransferase
MTEGSSSEQHRAAAFELGPVPVALVTVSDTRTPETDVNRAYLAGEIEKAGHALVAYRLLRDEPADILAALDELAETEARVILFNGGTGIAARDTTYDALASRLEKTLPGFGEIFRLLSYEQVGAAAMLSRAVAGVYRGRFVVSLPGSPSAVRLAWEKLLLPEIGHLAWELVR